jgi:SRSO17 transposase
MCAPVESQFQDYSKAVASALGHADRHEPATLYLKGLLLPGERKSVEAMAARVCPENVRSAHQSIIHLVAAADWDDQSAFGFVAQQIAPELLEKEERCWWIVDDTSHVKKGMHSVGVARQYCARVGKTENCQVAVSLSLANSYGSVPLNYRLYFQRNGRRMPGVAVRQAFLNRLGFKRRDRSRTQIEQALAQGISRGIVLADAAYGVESEFRDWLQCQNLDYVLGVRTSTTVWWGKHQSIELPLGPNGKRGRPRSRVQRSSRHQPISVLDLARFGTEDVA